MASSNQPPTPPLPSTPAPQPIVLVGFMGSGKTTVGRALAARLHGQFLDLDDLIEAAEQRTIASIFDTEGEAHFRQLEHQTLAAFLRQAPAGSAAAKPLVLALGGGAFAQPANQALLTGHATTIWLDVPFERALARVQRFAHRPLARDPEKFAALYAQRREAYAKANHRIVIGSDEPGDAVAAILALL